MEIITLVNINGALISIIIQVIHKYFYSKGFRRSFISFKNKLDTEFKTNISDELDQVRKNIKNTENQKIIEKIKKLYEKYEEQNIPAISYARINKNTKFFYLFSIGSIFLSILSFKVPKIGEYLSEDLGFISLLISIFILFSMIWSLCKLEEKIVKSELGIPIKDILEEKK